MEGEESGCDTMFEWENGCSIDSMSSITNI
jgi:hypothetical protein